MEQEILQACSEASVMIMGISFIVGSLTTIFVLVLLDMYRCYSMKPQEVEESHD